MSGKLVSIKVDVTKLDKSKFFKADSGAVYADLDVWINEDEQEDWKKVSINQSQTKEQRDAKEKKTFCGNGKLLFGWESGSGEQSPASAEITAEDVPF